MKIYTIRHGESYSNTGGTVMSYTDMPLTEKGREIAERVYERHVLFTNWMTSMGVPEDIAAEDACRIEHCLSTESFEAIKKHVQQYNK